MSRRVVVVEHVTLDGVMQGPGRADEDTRDGFTLGGWAQGRRDDRLPAAMGERLGQGFEWLLGRRTYEDLLAHWYDVGGPFADGLNATTKHVATSDPDRSLEWPSSQRLGPDVVDAVSDLRSEQGGHLVIMGSGALVRSLVPHGLVGELFLMVHPVVLGSGKRLFGPLSSPSEFRLERSETTDVGSLLLTYRAVAG